MWLMQDQVKDLMLCLGKKTEAQETILDTTIVSLLKKEQANEGELGALCYL